VQTFGLSLRGVENATVTPVSTFSPSFNTLHRVLLLTHIASLTLFCTFERGIVIPTSDCFHEFVHIINYFTLTTPFYPLLPTLQRHFQAVINILAKDNTIAAY
jgi:hypothetical protein